MTFILVTNIFMPSSSKLAREHLMSVLQQWFAGDGSPYGNMSLLMKSIMLGRISLVWSTSDRIASLCKEVLVAFGILPNPIQSGV